MYCEGPPNAPSPSGGGSGSGNGGGLCLPDNPMCFVDPQGKPILGQCPPDNQICQP